MIIVKAPVRISFFGGSTDYKCFFREHGSFLIGTTIDKYAYLSIRKRPEIFSKESIITNSKIECVDSFEKITNPMIRETLKYSNIMCPIELSSFSDIPSRTGLGGSSSFCVGLLYAIKKLMECNISKKQLAKDVIHIEREILNESGGIQDQIWASYGGFNSIEIRKDGEFFVKPMPISEEFHKEFENSLVLIYTNSQRNQCEIAKSHENKDKIDILNLSYEAYKYFLKEDIQMIGTLMYESWKQKNKLSTLISTSNVDLVIKRVMELGAYGGKLLGSGGCGFVAVICNEKVKMRIIEEFNTDVLNVKFEKNGVQQIH